LDVTVDGQPPQRRSASPSGAAFAEDMAVSNESYIGEPSGADGVKLEEQVLITDPRGVPFRSARSSTRFRSKMRVHAIDETKDPPLQPYQLTHTLRNRVLATSNEPACSADGMPKRFFAVRIGGLNHAAYARIFHRRSVKITITTRLKAVRRQGDELVATLGSDYGEGSQERRVDQVVVEHGTLPMANLCDELKPLSLNLVEVHHRALPASRPQEVLRNADGRFRLFRVGEAVASRNMHTAIFDALRLAKDV
jgi:hypothetical protein